MKRTLSAALAAVAMTAGLAALASPASADDLTCYEVGFDHLPGASASTRPPHVVVDDGDPYIRSYPC